MGILLMDLQDLDSLTVEYKTWIWPSTSFSFFFDDMGMERCDPGNIDFQNYTIPVDVMNSLKSQWSEYR